MMVEKFFFRKFNKCCAFLMLLLFASGTLWAGHSPEKITLKVTNEKLVKVLEEIKKQSGYNFVYNEKFVKDLGGITVDVKEVSLDSVMKEVLKGTGLRYRIQVTFINRLIINCLYNCIAYNMPTFLIYYRLFLT